MGRALPQPMGTKKHKDAVAACGMVLPITSSCPGFLSHVGFQKQAAGFVVCVCVGMPACA